MRRPVLLALAALPLTACQDSLDKQGIPTAPRLERHSAEANDSRPGIPSPDLWASLSAEEKLAAVGVIESVYAAQGAVYLRGQIAIVPGDLPGSARVLVVRDPAAPERPLLVLSEKTMDDGAVLSGIVAFSQEVEHAPDAAVRRVLRVTADHRIVDERGRSRKLAGPAPRNGQRWLTDRLFSSAKSVTSIDLPGIGPATLLSFQ
jgi:hypothetical protein